MVGDEFLIDRWVGFIIMLTAFFSFSHFRPIHLNFRTNGWRWASLFIPGLSIGPFSGFSYPQPNGKRNLCSKQFEFRIKE